MVAGDEQAVIDSAIVDRGGLVNGVNVVDCGGFIDGVIVDCGDFADVGYCG